MIYPVITGIKITLPDFKKLLKKQYRSIHAHFTGIMYFYWPVRQSCMKRKNILIIEDDEAILEIISYLLLAEGFDPLACDKLEPLTRIVDHAPDLILLDEWVNAKEGPMLCREIKQIHALARVPVIILSTSPGIAQIALACKADGLISKPFEVATLLKEINRCLAIPTGAFGVN